MARYCLDANVAVSYFFEQGYPSVDGFWSSLSTDDELVSAQLWRAECTSVIRAAAFAGRITHAHSLELVDRLLAIPVRILDDSSQFVRAVHLARAFQHRRSYDMQYLAAAAISESLLVTRDRGLRHAATQIGVPVRFLA